MEKKYIKQPYLEVVDLKNDIIATSATFVEGTTNHALVGARGYDEEEEW